MENPSSLKGRAFFDFFGGKLRKNLPVSLNYIRLVCGRKEKEKII